MSRRGALAPVLLAAFALAGCGQFAALFGEPASPSPTTTASASGSASPTPTLTTPPGVGYEETGGASPVNFVQVDNKQDGKVSVAARVQLNTMRSDSISPVNVAFARATCVGCRTMAVALQLNLYPTSAHVVTPANAAVAVNAGCTGCITIARALQYDIPVDDPTQVPSDVRRLVAQMRQELAAISSDNGIDIYAADQRVSAVIAQFKTLAATLNDRREVRTDTDSPTPTPGVLPSVTPTPAPPASSTPAPSTPSSSPTGSP